jgi:hypothetical protein
MQKFCRLQVFKSLFEIRICLSPSLLHLIILLTAL